MNKSYIVWLIGCNGMLAKEVARELQKNNIPFVGTDREVDITNISALEKFASDTEKNKDVKIKWIINCSGYTAVEKAEEEPEFAKLLNETGPKNIATLAKKIGAKLIHISTDYVFGGIGNTPFTEDAPLNPMGVYGKTKADGEKVIIETLPNNFYILRTAWLYGFEGKNFVYTMLKLMNNKPEIKVVDDQIGTPTFAGDLAFCICKIIQDDNNLIPSGIYHCTNLGIISWFDFATEIYKLGKKHNLITNECKVLPCTTEEYGAKVQRPTYSVLNKDKIQKTLNITLPEWQESLEYFINSPLFRKDM